MFPLFLSGRKKVGSGFYRIPGTEKKIASKYFFSKNKTIPFPKIYLTVDNFWMNFLSFEEIALIISRPYLVFETKDQLWCVLVEAGEGPGVGREGGVGGDVGSMFWRNELMQLQFLRSTFKNS